MYNGTLINDLIAVVERVEARLEARLEAHDERPSELTLWGAVIAQQAPTLKANLAEVA